MKIKKHTLEVMSETIIGMIIIQFLIIMVLIVALVCQDRIFANVINNQYPTVVITDDFDGATFGYYK